MPTLVDDSGAGRRFAPRERVRLQHVVPPDNVGLVDAGLVAAVGDGGDGPRGHKHRLVEDDVALAHGIVRPGSWAPRLAEMPAASKHEIWFWWK